MSDKITNIKLVGIGGMGVLKASLILADVVFKAGFSVKKAEVHGMSQRGGSVCSDVRFGKEVFSPMIPSGEIDILVAIQDDQKDLYMWECNDNTIILSASQIDEKALPNKKSANVAMLGLLSCYLDFPVETWLEEIKLNFKEQFFDANKAAFEYGRTLK